MIKSVTVTNWLGDKLKLELRSPEKSGLIIQSIDGIGPGEATIASSEMANFDGAMFTSARAPSREITFNFIFMWNPTIEESRHLTYKYFPLKKEVTLEFETDTRKVGISGVVQSNTPSIFDAQEGASIVVNCSDPRFYNRDGGGTETTNFFGINSLFECPFSNESLTQKLIIFGEILNKAENNIYYTGEVETGITIRIHALDTIGDITILNKNTLESMTLDASRIQEQTGSRIIAGDTVVIRTHKGKKRVTLTRAGATTNIINALGRYSDWFQLAPGDNIFTYSATSGQEWLQFSIEVTPVFEGV